MMNNDEAREQIAKTIWRARILSNVAHGIGEAVKKKTFQDKDEALKILKTLLERIEQEKEKMQFLVSFVGTPGV